MKLFKIILPLIILSLFLIQCNEDTPPAFSHGVQNLEVNQKTNLESMYFQENLDNRIHLDSVSFEWSAGDLLDNKYVLNPDGGQAIFTPKKEGSYDISLTVKHKWTGEILKSEIFSFVVASKDIAPLKKTPIKQKSNATNTSTSSKTDTSISKHKQNTPPVKQTTPSNKISKLSINADLDGEYQIQISYWEKKEEVDLELKMLESQGLSPYTQKYKNGWRVRIGNFKSYKDAKIAAKKISKKLESIKIKREPWVTKIEINQIPTMKDSILDKDIKANQKKDIEVENLIDFDEEKELETPQNYIQISTWRNKKDAERELEAIKSLGYSPFILEAIDKNNYTWYKVRIGPLSEKESSDISFNLSTILNKRISIVK